MFRSKFVKFFVSILNWQVNSSSNFVSFLIVMTHNSPENFKLIYFLLLIKVFYQSPNFETFECSVENLSNSTCHFWKRKSVFLQILYQSSVFCWRFVKFLKSFLKAQVSFLSNFTSMFSAIKHNSFVLL